jgi:hypothetical protein
MLPKEIIKTARRPQISRPTMKKIPEPFQAETLGGVAAAGTAAAGVPGIDALARIGVPCAADALGGVNRSCTVAPGLSDPGAAHETAIIDNAAANTTAKPETLDMMLPLFWRAVTWFPKIGCVQS